MSSTKRGTTKTPPEEAGTRVVANFCVEFLPGVESDYELLRAACNSEPKISYADLQVEVLVYGLHCLDRVVFSHHGADYRNSFMDSALRALEKVSFAAAARGREGDWPLERLRSYYNERQREYGAMVLLPEKGASPKGTLFWEYAKRICLNSNAAPPIMTYLLDQASTIFEMMDEIAQGL